MEKKRKANLVRPKKTKRHKLVDADFKVMRADMKAGDNVMRAYPPGVWEDLRGFEFYFEQNTILFYEVNHPAASAHDLTGWVIRGGCRSWGSFEEARKHFDSNWRKDFDDYYFHSFNHANLTTVSLEKLTRENCRRKCLRILSDMEKAAKRLRLVLVLDERQNARYHNSEIYARLT